MLINSEGFYIAAVLALMICGVLVGAAVVFVGGMIVDAVGFGETHHKQGLEDQYDSTPTEATSAMDAIREWEQGSTKG